VPTSTRKIMTVCTACKAHITADVSVGGVGQEGQAGRARQKAGGRMMAGGGAAGHHGSGWTSQCTCSAARRKLVVRHPLLQMQRLLDEHCDRMQLPQVKSSHAT